MRHLPLYIFLGIMAVTGGMMVRGAEYVSFAYQNNISSKLQANLLSLVVSSKEKEKDLRPVHLLFTGDIMLGRAVGQIMDIRKDFKYPFLQTASVLRSADLTFGNLEGPITYSQNDVGSIYSFAFNPSVIEGLKYSGFDVLSLANNHIFDRGYEGMEDTMYFLNQSNINYVGVGKNEISANKASIFMVRGIKFAFLAYTPFYSNSHVAWREKGGLSRLDGNYIKDIVSKLKNEDEVDVVIVSMHFGDEYKKEAGNYQRELAKVLSLAQVDLIVGHHPHVTQEIEKINETWVAYSLGNFVFDQTFEEDVRNGFVLSVLATKDGIQSVEGVPIYINDDYQPEFVK